MSGGRTVRDALAEALAVMPYEHMSPSAITAALLPVVEAECRRRAAEAEKRGYERGRRDFQFAPEGDNHHNAAMCPYCSPVSADAIEGRT